MLPKTRGDCIDGERPCPYVSCKYHLLLNPNISRLYSWFLSEPRTASAEEIVDALNQMKYTCTLDVVDENGPLSPTAIADLVWTGRKCVDRIIDGATATLKRGYDEEVYVNRDGNGHCSAIRESRDCLALLELCRYGEDYHRHQRTKHTASLNFSTQGSR